MAFINEEYHPLKILSWTRVFSLADTLLPNPTSLMREILRETFRQLECSPSRVPRKIKRFGHPEGNKDFSFYYTLQDKMSYRTGKDYLLGPDTFVSSSQN